MIGDMMTRLDQAARNVRTARTATLVAGGVTAAAFFIPADIVDALTRPGYNPLRHWVSHLSLGEYGWVGTSILIVTSASLMAYATGLHRMQADRGGSRGYPVAVALSAAGLALAALFPMDPSLGFPPGAKTGISLAGSIHNIAGPLFIGAMATAAFLSHRFLLSLGIDLPYARWGWRVGTGALVSFTICSVLVGLDYSGAGPQWWSGLFERLAIYLSLAWGAVTATALRRRIPACERSRLAG
jgi:hypothetical protein